MEYRELGDSGIELSRITFGAWSIGQLQLGDPTREDALAALRKAYEMGCTSIDTAPGYNKGFAEEVVAEAISGLPRDKVQVLTKCGMVWGGGKGKLVNTCTYQGQRYEIYRYAGKESVIKECEDSLRRLNTDYIDLYSLHFPDPTTPIEETMEAFSLLLQQGKIRAAGLCNCDAEIMRKADALCPVVSNKARYSMLNRGIENDLIPYSLENDKAILAYSVLQRGILTGMDMRKFLWPEDNSWEVALYEPANAARIRAFLDKLQPMAEDKGVTLTQLCVRWTLDRPGITVTLLGASSEKQVMFDLRAMDITLDEEETNTINRYLSELEAGLELGVRTRCNPIPDLI
jgi:aryl-alcohol dehydrogenase-like predicted oxidoreductase